MFQRISVITFYFMIFQLHYYTRIHHDTLLLFIFLKIASINCTLSSSLGQNFNLFFSYFVESHVCTHCICRSRVVSPNASLDGSLVLGSGESLADAFSTEMLAWYQDQNIPRSATLV